MASSRRLGQDLGASELPHHLDPRTRIRVGQLGTRVGNPEMSTALDDRACYPSEGSSSAGDINRTMTALGRALLLTGGAHRQATGGLQRHAGPQSVGPKFKFWVSAPVLE